MHQRGDLEAQLEPLALEEAVRDLNHDPRAVAREWIGSGGCAMGHALQHFQRPLDDRSGFLALDVGDEADPAAVLLGLWIVKPVAIHGPRSIRSSNMRTLIALIFLPLVALAQTEAEAAPPVAMTATQPVQGAEPILPDWNVGAGIGFSFGTLGSTFGLLGNGGLGGLSGLSPSVQPRLSLLVERRLSERLFFSFQAAASYSGNQSSTNSAMSSRNITVDGTVGLRRVFNPRGIVEVSWFGSVGVGYGNYEYRALTIALDRVTSTYQEIPQASRGSSFSVGGVTGLALERELIAGLALRLSSSILGLSFASNQNALTTGDTTVDNANHGLDAGLRFSPTIELRYAF